MKLTVHYIDGTEQEFENVEPFGVYIIGPFVTIHFTDGSKIGINSATVDQYVENP